MLSPEAIAERKAALRKKDKAQKEGKATEPAPSDTPAAEAEESFADPV